MCKLQISVKLVEIDKIVFLSTLKVSVYHSGDVMRFLSYIIHIKKSKAERKKLTALGSTMVL